MKEMVEIPLPPILPNNQLAKMANRLIKAYVNTVGAQYVSENGIKFDDLYDSIIYPEYEIVLNQREDLGVTDTGEAILGKFIASENTALISKTLHQNHDPRKVFTLYHEVAGHGILHGAYLRRLNKKGISFFTTGNNLYDVSNIYERQANYFAAEVAACPGFIKYLLNKIMRTPIIMFVEPGEYMLTFHERTYKITAFSPRDIARFIAGKLKYFFGGLSTEALAIQIQKHCINSNGYTFEADSSPFCKVLNDVLPQ